VPAHDVERQVFLRLQSFLQSGREVMDELSLPEDPAARTQQILAGAAKQFDQLSSGAPAVVKGFVRRVVQRVVVDRDRIEVEVGKQELRATLTADPHASSVQRAAEQLEQGSSAAIRLNIEARVKRCGGEMRLVFPPDHPGQAPSLPASSLLRALARGRCAHGVERDRSVVGSRSDLYPTARAVSLYLAVILDAFSRRALGWALDDSLATPLSLAALRQAIQLRQPAPGLVHHSDRGLQYASKEYVTVLLDHHVAPSMSRPGNPYDNAKCESFMKTLKQEEIHTREYRDRADLEAHIGHFLEQYYNRQRLHSALNYRSPEQFERSFAGNLPHLASS